jgi:hypothetical protein
MEAPDQQQQQPAQAVEAAAQPTSSQQQQAQQEAVAAAPAAPAAANAGAAAAAAAPGSSDPSRPSAAAEGPIYVSKREVRRTVGKVLGKKTAYYLEFYLVDNHGYETLAAIGEDQGARGPVSLSCAGIHACVTFSAVH